MGLRDGPDLVLRIPAAEIEEVAAVTGIGRGERDVIAPSRLRKAPTHVRRRRTGDDVVVRRGQVIGRRAPCPVVVKLHSGGHVVQRRTLAVVHIAESLAAFAVEDEGRLVVVELAAGLSVRADAPPAVAHVVGIEQADMVLTLGIEHPGLALAADLSGDVGVHRIVQQENGDLSVLPIEEKETQLSGVSALTLENIQGNAELVFEKQIGTRYRVDFMMEFSELTYRFGVKIYENSAIDSGYAYQFVPGEQKAEFDRLPNMKWFIYLNKGMAQSVSLIPGKKYPVTVLVQDDISVLYVDGVAISARMKEKPGDELKFYVESGKLAVSEITLDREAVK